MERIEDFSSTLMLRSGSGTVPGAGQTSFSIPLLSYKVKSINGKPQSARTIVGFEYSLPSWVTYKTSVENSNRDGYSLIVDIAKNPGSTSRSGTITLTQRESGNKDTFTITQGSNHPTFTLQGLTTLTPNSQYFLFASGHFPSPNNKLSQYLMIMSEGSEITLPIPCTVNMSNPGQRYEANTGDRVRVFQYSNDHFVSAGSFIVPSAGGTVSI